MMTVLEQNREKPREFAYRTSLPGHMEPGSIAIELGVAKGDYSEALLRHDVFDKVYSVDRWTGERGHNNRQCQGVVKRLAKYEERSEIIQASFDQALVVLEDESFDFIYVDGYAHEGYLDTLLSWWDKLKPWGLFAVHDYHRKWPKNVKAIDTFRDMKQITDYYLTRRDKFPTWWTIKKP